MIIPSAVYFTLQSNAESHHTLSTNSARQSLWRDTVFLILAQGLLFLVIRPVMHWWHGILLIGFYATYLFFLLKFGGKEQTVAVEDEHLPAGTSSEMTKRQYHLDIYGMVLGLDKSMQKKLGLYFFCQSELWEGRA